MASSNDMQAEALDERRFADAGNARNTQADGAPGIRQKLTEQRLGGLAMVGAGRFDEGYGARQGAALACPHRRGKVCGSGR